MSAITDIRREKLTNRIIPFEVTQGHWKRWDRSATYDYLLVNNINYGPISYRFRHKR